MANITGTDGNDILTGTGESDSILGLGGNDELRGGDSGDLLDGGDDFATDILVGGDGADVFDGGSLLGDYDLMNGGPGDDVYWVDTPADLTFEAAGEGIDTVSAFIDGAGYYLYPHAENLYLGGATPFGVGNVLDNVLVGSELTNWLLGGAGADILAGMAGNDVLFGESGADIFVFGPGSGQDLIGDFAVGTDKVRLVGSYTDFAQVQSHFVQNGANGAIDLGGGNFIVLNGVTMSTLAATDFIFG